MPLQALLTLIDAWVQRGWLRSLDRAFLRFLHELDAGADPLLLLAAALASHQLGRGHICLDLAATLDAPDETLSLPPEGEFGQALADRPSRILAGQTPDGWLQALAASPLVSTGPGNSPLVLIGQRLYLRRYWNYERQVAAAIQARLQFPPTPPQDLSVRLAELFPGQAGTTDWQKVACALAARGSFSVITGGPGTGKTTTVVKLLALLQGAAQRKLRIRLAAPTGKAAARLTESIGNAIARLPSALQQGIPTEATTLHRLLGSRQGTRRLRHDAANPLHADWVVVDEASMIDLEMMAALLDALRPDTRLVLLGDKDQLASVEAGSVLGDLCRGAGSASYVPDTIGWLREVAGVDVGGHAGAGGPLAQQVAMLRVSHRFRRDSGIGQLALAVNAGSVDEARKVWSRRAAYADIASLVLHGQDDGRLERLVIEGGAGHFAEAAAVEPVRGYRHYLELMHASRPGPDADAQDYAVWAGTVLAAFDQFQLLCALRRGPWGVEQLNQRIAAALHKARLIGQTQGWYEGRPVLVTRNDYSLGLMNGDIGIALAFPEAMDHSHETRSNIILPLPSEESRGEGSNHGVRAAPDNERHARYDRSTGRLRVVFRQPDHTLKQVLPSRLTDVETVYAMTVHKSQGSEFTHVGLLLPDAVSPILTRELVYTGITRAKRWFSLLMPNEAVLAHAVTHPVRRSGGLMVA
ncbi:MAG: exodeoxyribonuclease V subunit alpha [Methylococcaceae bacterium]|nr:MAG: exodeoxyribonuclease V subunit alpha [Methylococcaceae bacterium]